MKIDQANTAPSSMDSHIPISGRLLLGLLEKLQHGRLMLTTPDGMSRLFGASHATIQASLTIHDWRCAGLILNKGDIGFAESLRQGWLDTPDMLNLFRLAIHNQRTLQRAIHGKWWSLLLRRLTHLVLRDNSRAGSKRNIQAHYDLGNAFYRLWLDESMTYSAAWFGGNHNQSLYEAQLAKYDQILDELDAKPGQHILEIGCGWGGFAERAAMRGLHVYGITLSPSQLAYAQARIEHAGLAQQVTLSLQDYRDLNGQYDHIVSIEMLEAVGEDHWPSYFSVIKRSLKQGGKAVIQSIDIQDEHFEHYRTGTDFIQQFIFPGGMLPCPAEMRYQTRHAGLAISHVQSFGLDYARTLHLWFERFTDQLPAVRAEGFDEPFIRIWEMYLKYCEAAFLEKRTDVKLWTLTA